MITSSIVRYARGLLCALQPFTGERAAGKVCIRAKAGKQFKVPQYTYMMPVINDAMHWTWLFKVGAGPEPDGSWIVDEAGVELPLYSALGGQRFNVSLGTPFVFDYKIPELDLSPPPVAVAEFVGGQDPDDEISNFQDVAIYETFDGPAVPLDLRRSLLTRFPGALISFIDLTPADGVTSAQTRQGSVNAGTGTKFYKINYSISIIVSRTENDLSRRFQGMALTDRVLEQLVDLHACNDGESLSNPGGIQIRQVLRESGPQDVYKKFFIFTVLVSVMASITRNDDRVFAPWLRTAMDVDNPPPHPTDQGTLRLVSNVVLDMNGVPDMTLDGTFTRASDATFWNGSLLNVYGSGERRIVRGKLLLEPAIPTLASFATDFSLWSSVNGASVVPNASSNPAGYATSADSVTLPNAGALELAGRSTTLGATHTFSVFVKAASVLIGGLRLEVDDGVSLFGQSFDLTGEWQRLYFECTPGTTSVTLRIKNGLGASQTLDVWGAQFSKDARWLAQFAETAKAKDVLTFNPPEQLPAGSSNTPIQVLTGKWRLEVKTLAEVPPDMVGKGLTVAPALVSVNDGSTDLVLLTLQGTGTVGATLIMYIRGLGAVLTLNAVMWTPGLTLSFGFDATGSLTIQGTDTHDGIYAVSRYDGSALPASDRLVLGNDAGGTRGAVPGFYSVEIDQ